MIRTALLFFFVAAPSLADVPPSDTQSCLNATVGAACKTDSGNDGTCQTSTCTRADYSNGPPPRRVPYDCLMCVTGAAPLKPAPANEPTPQPAKKACSVAPAELSLIALLGWAARRRRA